MKFRCERDVLVEALGTAGRAVADRGGALPVLSGIRARAHGQRAATDRQRPRPDDPRVESTVPASPTASVVLPARLAADIVRALAARRGRGRHRRRRGAHHRRAASQFAVPHPAGRRVPAAARAGRRRRSTLPAADVRGRRCARWCRPRAPTRPGRSSPACCSPPRTTACGWSPPTRTAWRCATCRARRCCAEGQQVLVPSRALRELTAAAGGRRRRSTLRLGERDATFEVGSIRLTTRLIEGEFPNYRGLIPQSYPNRLTVGREPLLDAVRRVKLLAREATPVRMVMRSRRARARRPSPRTSARPHEELDAKYEGTELTVAFNPEYLLAGIEVTPGDEVVARDPRRAEAGGDPLVGGRRLPVPADAGAGAVSSRGAASARLWLTDFRNYADADARARRRAHRRSSAPTARARRTCSRRSAYLATLDRFRGAPTEALVRDGRRPRRGAGRGRARRRPRAADRGRAASRGGRNRVQVNRQRLQRARDLLGALRVSVFSPDDLALVKGGPAERRRYLDDTLVALHPQLRRAALRARADPAPAQRAAEAGRRPADARRVALTLDVWDAKLADVGRGAWRGARAELRRPSCEPLRRRGVRRRRRRRRPTIARRATSRRGGERAWPRRSPTARTRRPAPRRHLGGPAPRRAATSCSPACRHAPTRRRASSARWRWRCASPRTRVVTDDIGDAAGAAARRRVLRARPRRAATRCCATSRRARCVLTTAGAPARRGAEPDLRPAASSSGTGACRAMSDRSDEPRPLGDEPRRRSCAALRGAGCSAPCATACFGRWDRRWSATPVAAHARPGCRSTAGGSSSRSTTRPGHPVALPRAATSCERLRGRRSVPARSVRSRSASGRSRTAATATCGSGPRTRLRCHTPLVDWTPS